VIGLFAVELVGAMRAAPASRWYPVVVGSLAGTLAYFVGYFTFSDRVAPYVWVVMGLGLLAARAAKAERAAE